MRIRAKPDRKFTFLAFKQGYRIHRYVRYER